MPTETSATPRDVCAAMNRLIRACVDDASAHLDAAGVVRGAGDRDALRSSAGDRDLFVRELRAIVERHGGAARRDGSLLRRLRVYAHHARAVLVGFNDGDAYLDCARLEAETARLYAVALDLRLPNDARSIVEHQRDTIAQDEARLRRKAFLR